MSLLMLEFMFELQLLAFYTCIHISATERLCSKLLNASKENKHFQFNLVRKGGKWGTSPCCVPRLVAADLSGLASAATLQITTNNKLMQCVHPTKQLFNSKANNPALLGSAN